jgi:uncharacterized integral membrane protein
MTFPMTLSRSYLGETAPTPFGSRRVATVTPHREGKMELNGPSPGASAPMDRPVVTLATADATGETRGARFARRAHRTRLYIYAGAAVALLVALIALVIANTGHVEVSWVVGSSSVSLIWLVVFSAVLGLLLGMVLATLFHWRTRTPRG